MDPTTNPMPNANEGAGAQPAATPSAGAAADLAAAAADLTAAAPMDAAASGVGVPAAAPVNPVINPTDPGGVSGGLGGTSAAPANPIINPTAGLDGMPATEPIMRPDLPPAPDPVKQELEAPMKAAAPVPGSIGSAVSMPEAGAAGASAGGVGDANVAAAPTGGNNPNVAFTDPATKPEATNGGVAPANPEQKTKKGFSMKVDLKNMNKGTLIALIVVAIMIVIALVAVLMMQLMG